MPSTDRKLELKAKTSVAQTGSQPYVYAIGLTVISRGWSFFVKLPRMTAILEYLFTVVLISGVM
jgi:hypothetical protein